MKNYNIYDKKYKIIKYKKLKKLLNKILKFFLLNKKIQYKIIK